MFRFACLTGLHEDPHSLNPATLGAPNGAPNCGAPCFCCPARTQRRRKQRVAAREKRLAPRLAAERRQTSSEWQSIANTAVQAKNDAGTTMSYDHPDVHLVSVLHGSTELAWSVPDRRTTDCRGSQLWSPVVFAAPPAHKGGAGTHTRPPARTRHCGFL